MVRISFEGTSHEVLQEMKAFLSLQQSAHTETVEPSKAEPGKKDVPPKVEKPKKTTKKETPKDDRQEEPKPVEGERIKSLKRKRQSFHPKTLLVFGKM